MTIVMICVAIVMLGVSLYSPVGGASVSLPEEIKFLSPVWEEESLEVMEGRVLNTLCKRKEIRALIENVQESILCDFLVEIQLQ